MLAGRIGQPGTGCSVASGRHTLRRDAPGCGHCTGRHSVAFVALFALTLPTAHLHGPSRYAQRHIAVHWHGLPLLDAVLAARQHATHHHVHMPVETAGSVGGVGGSRGWPGCQSGVGAAADKPLARDECRVRNRSPICTASCRCRSTVLAMLDFVWTTDALPATGCPDSPSRDSPARTPDDRIGIPTSG